MSARTHHLVSKFAALAFVAVLPAACTPSWPGRAPVQSSAQSSQECGGGVVVRPGDTVFSIARRCNVSMRELIEANDLSAPYVIVSGQTLRMPGEGSYIVRRGDALSLIAQRLKVDFKSLARMNGKRPPYTIYVGEKLAIPGSAVQIEQSLVLHSPNTGRADQPPVYRTERQISPPRPQSEPASPNRAEAQHPAFEPVRSVPPPPPALAGKGFTWPLKGDVIVPYGPMGKGQHNDGINIAAARGTPVRAAENGVIAYVGNELKGFGNLLLIKHADGWVSAYAHNDQLMVKKGDMVKRGQQIATVGSSGGVETPQLHFELRRGAEAVDPGEYLGGA